MHDAQQAEAVYADCGHEIYEGEHMIIVPSVIRRNPVRMQTMRLCPDCFRDWIADQPDEELADLMGFSVQDWSGE